MRLVLISDTHGHRGIGLPDGDVLVHAGDISSSGTLNQVRQFLEWFAAQPHRHKVFIAGNHDFLFEQSPDLAALLLADFPGLTYLQDSGLEIDGIRFWGSPWQPAYNDWAFNLPRNGDALRRAWDRIPAGTDVLITHGPAHGILDQVRQGPHLGCETLARRIAVASPRLHVFGHIHDAYGVAYSGVTVFANASTCDEDYRPVHRPILVDLSPERVEVLNTTPRPRLERVAALTAALDAAERAPGEIRAHQLLAVVQGLADLRQVARDELAEEYMRRGLRSDLMRMARAEAKPGRRPVPVKHLGGSDAG